MDYLTLQGKNANKYFNLNLIGDKYYRWIEVKAIVYNIIENEINEVVKDELIENVCKFQAIIDGRILREKILKDKFEKRGIKFIPHSYIVRNHIMYGRKTIDEVLDIMYMMKTLFEKCDIVNRWEEYKVKKGQQVYTFDEKDKFYTDVYQDYVSKL